MALLGAVAVLSVGASAVLAGEVTGTGTSLKVDDGGKWGTGLHARSFCAFSGQENLQYFTDDTDSVPKAEPTKGDPAFSQSWGQIPKAVRDQIGPLGFAPGRACNPNFGPPGEP